MQNKIPVQIEPGNRGDVPNHPKLCPLMFGRMHAKENELIFKAQRPSVAAIEHMLLRSREQSVNVHIYCIEPRQQVPLQFNQIALFTPSKYVLVSRSQVRLLLTRRELQILFVSKLRQCINSFGDIRGPDQQIEVSKLTHYRITVEKVRQRRPLLRDNGNSSGLEMLQN